MKIIFFGTPNYVIPVAESLRQAYNRTPDKGLVAVVTQEAKPSGRDKKITHSEVDHWAFKKHIPIITDLSKVSEADLGVVASYGKIIPQSIIDKFKYGVLNVHPSALPEFRGASPIQATIATGKQEATVTIIKMDKEMDHGPIVSSFKEEVLPTDTNDSLRARLFERAGDFLVSLIPSYAADKIILKDQDHSLATFTRTINKEDAYLDSELLQAVLTNQTHESEFKIPFIKDYTSKPTPENINNFIRAMCSWPCVWTLVKINGETKRLKIISSHIENEKLILDKVQLEGKNEVSWEEFQKGYPNFSF